MTSRADTAQYTVGWIAPLSLELAAATAMLEERTTLPLSEDGTLYHAGRIGDHYVVMVVCPRMGTDPAATVAANMRRSFQNIKHILVVGIGGGVPRYGMNLQERIVLGDVVISVPQGSEGGVAHYEFGAWEGKNQLSHSGHTLHPSSALLTAVNNLQQAHMQKPGTQIPQFLRQLRESIIQRELPEFRDPGAEHDHLFEDDYEHSDTTKLCEGLCDITRSERRNDRGSRAKRDKDTPLIHYGIIGSANTLMISSAKRNELYRKHRVICFEMESAGVMSEHQGLVIRGISDYADSHKNKKWQKYAAATAAACAKEILLLVPPPAGRTIYETYRSAVDRLNMDIFLSKLSVLDQDKHMCTIPPLDRGDPTFYWIFRNMDFLRWSSNKFPVLWVSGPPERNIRQVSSYVVGQEKDRALKVDRLVLYFFCSSTIGNGSIVTHCVHTLLNQIIYYSPIAKRILLVRSFLHSLLEEAFKDQADPTWERRGFNKEDHPDTIIKNILGGPANQLLAALGAVLGKEQRSLSLIVDGLEKVEHQKEGLIKEFHTFVNSLQQQNSQVKVLLTSVPPAEMKHMLDGLPCIEHDRERKECLDSLRFNNARYDKISPEHKGSFDWIWDHNQYRDWSTSDASRLLYIQGKPGSGKSTLTKYFAGHFLNLLKGKPAAESAIVGKFFYSYREGELQRSHYNMLRSILYDILDQDEAFFYHRLQTEYRDLRRREPRVTWNYKSLKTVLKSLGDYPLERRLYLIMDAVDESEKNDRRDILELLFELCSETKHCTTKVFITSRPVGELDLRISTSHHHFIRLQDETKRDISSFAHSFLEGLNLTNDLARATEYIVENAQGVFLWVKLVGEELETYIAEGYSEKQIFESLQGLPTELEDFYKLMLEKMNRNKRYYTDVVKIFRFVLFGRRPLTVDELLHALGVPDDLSTQSTLSDDLFQRRIPAEQRIIQCGGNFLEIKYNHSTGDRTVQVIHQTVREFFLDPNGHVANSELKMCEKVAQVCMSSTCILYLIHFAADPTSVGRPPNSSTWTYIRRLISSIPDTTLAPPDTKSWTSENFESYAKRLNQWPLANYALSHLKHHIDNCQQDASIQDIISRFIVELTRNPAVYLLERWISANLNKNLLWNRQGRVAEGFRNKLLYVAAQNGFSTAAAVLLTAGTDISSKNEDDRTPLSLAAGSGHEALVKLLLETGKAEADLTDGDGRTPLSWAAGSGHEVAVKLLLETGRAEADLTDGDGRTPLSWAAGSGHEVVVKLLLETGKVEADSKDNKYDGRTPLSWAAGSGHEAVVKLLLETSKAEADSRDKNGRTPLSWAAGSGHEAVVKLLLETGKVEANLKDENGQIPLLWAATSGHEAVVKLLLETGNARTDFRDWRYSRSPLSWAAGSGHEAVVKLLLEADNTRVDSKDRHDRTPLSWAAGSGHEAVVKLLLETGKAGADLKDRNRRTPLSWAAGGGYEAVVKVLLETGHARAGLKDENGRTPLSWAAGNRHDAVVKLLCETGRGGLDKQLQRSDAALVGSSERVQGRS